MKLRALFVRTYRASGPEPAQRGNEPGERRAFAAGGHRVPPERVGRRARLVVVAQVETDRKICKQFYYIL
jgi:hypothetical protein